MLSLLRGNIVGATQRLGCCVMLTSLCFNNYKIFTISVSFCSLNPRKPSSPGLPERPTGAIITGKPTGTQPQGDYTAGKLTHLT